MEKHFSVDAKREYPPHSPAFYQFSARSINGELISMESYRGKVVLVVNTASACGFTPQYAGLEELYRKYKDRGFVVLAFPCNQFGQQEPGDEKAIAQFCATNYNITFPLFAKVEVNGKGAHELFTYLKKELPGTLGPRIVWNFTKFLIDRNGIPVKRFAPTTSPEKIEPYVLKLLEEKESG
ncbi:MAG: glutathione peroxidase [Chitinophagales bacterium]|nr:glutathione peroxidase [Chitinophagales bacterium]MDW8428354.1 glutathione peroxidase [Chitinophagales bacterium]